MFCPSDGSFIGTALEAEKLDPLLGTTVPGGYRVLKVLGEGGVAVVYKVKHPSGRLLAMKVLRDDLAHDATLRERFSREAHATAEIHHPNLLNVAGVGTVARARPYILMDLLDGETLAELRARRGIIPPRTAIDIAIQIAAALGALHDHGVLHRDLKPGNVQVAESGGGYRVTLFDLGLAHVAGKARITQPGIVHGTAHYMAPEQALGEKLDPRTDLYALGVVLYEMLNGQVPFPGKSYAKVLEGHLSSRPPPLDVAGERQIGVAVLEPLVMRCLEKRPEDRFGSVREFSLALERARDVLPATGEIVR